MTTQHSMTEGQAVAHEMESIRNLVKSQMNLLFTLRWHQRLFRRGRWLLEFKDESGSQRTVEIPNCLLPSLADALPKRPSADDPLVLDWKFGCALRQASWESTTITSMDSGERQRNIVNAVKLIDGRRESYWSTLHNALTLD